MTSTSSCSCASNSSYVSILVSSGLFLATALASQWMLRRLPPRREYSSDLSSSFDDDDENENDRLYRNEHHQLYSMRRARDRMSYENVMQFEVENDQAYVEEGGSYEVLQPVNRGGNWNHFEGYEEKDYLLDEKERKRRSSGPRHTAFLLNQEGDHTDDDASTSSGSEGENIWSNLGAQVRGAWPILPPPVNRRRLLEDNSVGKLPVRSGVRQEKQPNETVCLTEPNEDSMTSNIHYEPLKSSDAPSESFSVPLKGVSKAAPRRIQSSPNLEFHPVLTRQSSDASYSGAPPPRWARAQYNASIMPHKLILVRHGQSMGNINEHLYSTTADNAMPLTKLGWKQAYAAGEVLKEQLMESDSVHFIVSPYVRTVETFHAIAAAWCNPKEFEHIQDKDKRLLAWYSRLRELGVTWHEDPRIREQDFGNYQDPKTIQRAKRERHRFGVFYYRFPHGESASDVFDRVSTFLDSLWRSFDMNRCRNYVLVTHGISIRVLLARYFRYTIRQFSMLANPRNCEMVILGHDGVGKLQLMGRMHPVMKENDDTKETEVTGYQFHERLRVWPQHAVRKTRIRMSFDDE